MVRASDLITLPGMKKAPKKRIAAILEPSSGDGAVENNEELAAEESDDENASDTEDPGRLACSRYSFKSIQSSFLLYVGTKFDRLQRFRRRCGR